MHRERGMHRERAWTGEGHEQGRGIEQVCMHPVAGTGESRFSLTLCL
jgi:hypothetical protein